MARHRSAPDTHDQAAWRKAGMVQRLAGGRWGIPEPPREFVEAAKQLTLGAVEARAEGESLSSAFRGQMEARVGTHFEKLTPELTGAANDLAGAAFKKLQSAVGDVGIPGVSSEIAGGVVAAAQAVAGGDALGVAKAAAGIAGMALTPVLGPLGPIAGGLAAMALGALFGDEEKFIPPPPPPKPRDFSRKNPSSIPLWQVLEEVWLASQRWHDHKKSWVPPNDAIRALDFSYAPANAASGQGRINTAVFPSGHTAAWRQAGGPNVPMGPKYVHAYPLSLPSLGAPYVSTNADEEKLYIFTDDALAEFTAYSRKVAETLRWRLATLLPKDDALPKALRPFTPYFSEIGWAELITATALTEGWANHSDKLTRDLGSQNYKNVRTVCKAITKGIGNKRAYALRAEPLNGGRGMLCLVWSELQGILTAGPELRLQATKAETTAATQHTRFEKFVTDSIANIQASLGRIEPGMKKAAANTEKQLKKADALEQQVAKLAAMIEADVKAKTSSGFQMASAWPVAIGAAALAFGMWRATRRPT